MGSHQKTLSQISFTLSILGLLVLLSSPVSTKSDFIHGIGGIPRLCAGVIFSFAFMFGMLSWRKALSKTSFSLIIVAAVAFLLMAKDHAKSSKEYGRIMREKTLERYNQQVQESQRLESEVKAKEQPSHTPLPN